MFRCPNSGKAKRFSSPPKRPDSSGAHPAYYSVCVGFLLRRLKRPGPEFVQSPPRRTKLKNEWSCTSTVHIHLHVVDRDKLPCSVVRNEIFWICDILFDRAELRSARFLKHHTVLLAQSVQSKGAFHLPCQWTQTDHTCSWQGAKWRYFPTNFHSKILSSVKNTLN